MTALELYRNLQTYYLNENKKECDPVKVSFKDCYVTVSYYNERHIIHCYSTKPKIFDHELPTSEKIEKRIIAALEKLIEEKKAFYEKEAESLSFEEA